MIKELPPLNIQHPPVIPISGDKSIIEYRMEPLRQQWLRCVAPQLGLNAADCLIGYAVEDIIDDSTNIYWGASQVYYLVPNVPEVVRERCELYLSSMAAIPELPETITYELESYLVNLKSFDLHNYDEFTSAMHEYYQMVDKINKIVNNDSKLLRLKNNWIKQVNRTADYWSEYAGWCITAGQIKANAS